MALKGWASLPVTYPLVRVTVAEEPRMTVFAEAASTLAPRARVPLIVASVPLRETDALPIVRLLKVVADEPPIAWGTDPFRLIVLPVFVKVAPLFVQLPLTLCTKAPATKVVPEPRTTLPLMDRAAAAVTDAVPAVVNVPATVITVPGMVFAPLPLRVRLPYVCAETVCVPALS